MASQEEDDLDSLFEGMVLFTATPTPAPAPAPAPAPDSSSSLSPPPLDDNLFADLSLQNPPEQASVEEASAAAVLQNSSFRKKKRASGLRVGYGRDRRFADQDVLDSPSPSPSPSPSAATEEITAPIESSEARFEEIRALIALKLNTAREAVSRLFAARKDAIRDRRKAALLLSQASARYSELETLLEEACEAEDFETADRLGDDLASADKDKQTLGLALTQAEARCDDLEYQMRQALEFQIQNEEESASLLQNFSMESSTAADLVQHSAQAVSSTVIEDWTSSTEEVELKRLQLEIESHLMNQARSALHDSVLHLTKDDHAERDLLYQTRQTLSDQLLQLYALVKQKEAEIAENDLNIQRVEEKIASVASNVEEAQSNLDEKLANLGSALHQLDLDYDLLSQRKNQTDAHLSLEEARGTKVREISKMAAAEADKCHQVVRLRKSLMHLSLKILENKMSLSKTEQQLTEDVGLLKQEIAAARTSLQELSSTKSSIQKEIESFKQRIFFIDKRAPELEAEKKAAASARNFKEAARIATEAKALSTEREGLGVKMEGATLQLQNVEEEMGKIMHTVEETEIQVLSKTKELEMARFKRLVLLSDAAKAERSAALDEGDIEEANKLSAEADAADAEASRLQLIYNYRDEEIMNESNKQFVPLELVSKLGVEQLAELATSCTS